MPIFGTNRQSVASGVSQNSSRGFIGFSTPLPPLPNAATLGKLRVNVASNTLNGPAIISIAKNGVATALSVTIPAGATGLFSLDTNAQSFVAGDSATFLIDTTGASSGTIGFAASVESDLDWIYAYENPAPGTRLITEGLLGSSSAFQVRAVMTGSGNLRNLRVNLPTNTLNAALTVAVALNGVATGLAVTYAAGETGVKTASGPDVPFVEGDDVVLRPTAPTATSGFAILRAGWELGRP